MNYYVPDFGMDKDIIDSMASKDHAESTHGKEIPVPKKVEKESLAQYDFGTDREIMSV